MIENVKYLVTCDDCINYSAYKHKSEIKEHGWVIYRYHKVNPMADELFVEKMGFVPKVLHFCTPECAERYFDYYPERKSHYKLVK